MKITYKYRLYPSKKQRTIMNGTLNACCWVYNKTLEVRKDTWEKYQRPTSRYDTIKMLPKWKHGHPILEVAYSQVLQEVCTRVDLAFNAFFRRCKSGKKPGFPRFHGRRNYNSFTYPQSGFKIINDGTLCLSKIGNIKIKLHRPIKGTVKTLTVKRDRLDNWWASFSCEINPEPRSPSPDVVGIDVGLTHFVTLSTGEHIDNPRFFRKDEQSLAKAQRRLSKCKKGTKEYQKHRRTVQHIHKRIASRRSDFIHKLSSRLVNEFQIIAFEDLDIQGMKHNNFRSMNKSINDAAWGQLIALTQAKAEWAGRTVVTIDPHNTTQMCSSCEKIVQKDLSVRIHDCPFCGLFLDRDENAARNILARGLACLDSDS